MVLWVLRGEDDPTVINNICIVLIPKVENREELGQFRPISLCNVISKIASKVMANRLKMFYLRSSQRCNQLLSRGA